MARAHIIQVEPGGHLKIEVVLSRRNLLSLLHKLDMEGSARELQNNDVRVNGHYPESVMMHLFCEDDAEHYAKRKAPPGEMHPDTEEFVEKGDYEQTVPLGNGWVMCEKHGVGHHEKYTCFFCLADQESSSSS